LPFRLYIPFDGKILKEFVSINEKFGSAAAIEDQFRKTEVYVLVTYQDGKLPPEPSPSTPPSSSSMLLTTMMRRE
jgi:hypothetical protein